MRFNMKLKLQKILKLLCVPCILVSNYVYAEAAQFVGVTMKNNTEDNIHLERYRFWDRTGITPDADILSRTENYFYSKGAPLRGAGGIYVYKLEDGLYLDMIFRQNHYGYYEYQVCFSDRARLKFSDRMYVGDYNKLNPAGMLSCAVDTSNSNKFVDKGLSYEDVTVLVHVKTEKSGAFKAYNSKQMTITIDNKCRDNPVYQSASFIYTKEVPSREAIYAMHKGCLYYSYCPPKSGSVNKMCNFKGENDVYTGAFYPVSSDNEIVSLFSNQATRGIGDKIIGYKEKPADRDFIQHITGNKNIRVGQKVSASDLRSVMDEVDQQYCDYITSKNKDSICHNSTYAMQPRVANQLKYIDKKYLNRYNCYVSSLTYPNIGYNICQLTSKYTILNGVITEKKK